MDHSLERQDYDNGHYIIYDELITWSWIHTRKYYYKTTLCKKQYGAQPKKSIVLNIIQETYFLKQDSQKIKTIELESLEQKSRIKCIACVEQEKNIRTIRNFNYFSNQLAHLEELSYMIIIIAMHTRQFLSEFYKSRLLQKLSIESLTSKHLVQLTILSSLTYDCSRHSQFYTATHKAVIYIQSMIINARESLSSHIHYYKMTNPKTHCYTVFRDQYKGVDIFEEEEDIQNKHQEAKFEENTNTNLNHLREEIQRGEDHCSQESQQKQIKTGKKSLNHNFQKHAVTTIKKLMRMKYNRDGTLVQKLAHEMWNIFMASGIKSKKILVILFGLANMNDQGFIDLLKKCGFDEILCYDQNLIRSAQQILRERLNASVNEEVVRENIANCRNIKMSQQFLVYFLQLLQTLREGPLLKLRINDRTAKKIQATIKAQKSH